ncbi:MAG: hypothetical protein WC356_03280 [Candidatus Micrarchaeia archaeon]|jgi:hypothetical protein
MGDYMTTTIAINETTRELLKNFGKKDETYDEIINKLIELTEIIRFHERQDYILKNEKFKKFDELKI